MSKSGSNKVRIEPTAKAVQHVQDFLKKLKKGVHSGDDDEEGAEGTGKVDFEDIEEDEK